MKQQPTLPTGQAQGFAVHETFFSTTDDRGVITAGNDVFVRISGYTLPELLGQPHNLIRHPDMPRSVFHRLWATARAGRSFAGYVKNHAKNGNHYWVFALILPLDRGYLSVRLKPTTPLLAAVEQLYGRMHAAEQTALARGEPAPAAIAASAAVLDAELARLGFADYDAFARHALSREIKSRDEAVVAQKLALFPATLGQVEPAVEARYRQHGRVCAHLRALFGILDRFIETAERLRARHDAVQRLAGDFRLAALNAQVASHALGSAGTVTGTVAHFLDAYAGDLAGHVGELTGRIDAAVGGMAEIAFNLSAARVLLEVMLSFLAEVAARGVAADERERLRSMLADLRAAFHRTMATALARLDEFGGRVPEIQASGTQIWQDFIRLQVAQISGLTEVARLPAAENLRTMFQGLRALITGAQAELRELLEVIEGVGTVHAAAAPEGQAIRRALAVLAEPSAKIAAHDPTDSVPAPVDARRPEAPVSTGAPVLAVA